MALSSFLVMRTACFGKMAAASGDKSEHNPGVNSCPILDAPCWKAACKAVKESQHRVASFVTWDSGESSTTHERHASFDSSCSGSIWICMQERARSDDPRPEQHLVSKPHKTSRCVGCTAPTYKVGP